MELCTVKSAATIDKNMLVYVKTSTESVTNLVHIMGNCVDITALPSGRENTFVFGITVFISNKLIQGL
jgi:hypothetical protein